MVYGLGIDVGTTFTAAAVSRADQVEMVILGDQSVVTPSVVYAGADGVLLAGDAAVVRAPENPGRSAREFKRRMGDPTPFILGGVPYAPTVLFAALVRHVVQTVVEVERERPERVTLTYPASWGPYRREQFADVAAASGLPDALTMPEPAAAAAHYATAAGRAGSDRDVIALYDLGGGTFDTAVLRAGPAGFEIVGVPDGIDRTGGVDFDDIVFQYVDDVTDGGASSLDLSDPAAAAALARLRQDCVLAKERLSVESHVTIPVFLHGRHRDVTLARRQFEQRIRPLLDATIDAVRRALRSAQVGPADLTEVILAGGSSRIPLVTERLTAELGRPIRTSRHPKHAVALGAAAIAAGDRAGSPRRGGPPRAGAHRGGDGSATADPATTTAGFPRLAARADATPPAPAHGRRAPTRARRVRAALAAGAGLLLVAVLAYAMAQRGSAAGRPQPGSAAGQPPAPAAVGQPSRGSAVGQPSQGSAGGQPPRGSAGGQAPRRSAAGQPPGGSAAGQPAGPFSLAASLAAPTVATTIAAVGNRPQGTAITPDGRQLWVPSSVSGTVTVIDTGSDAVIVAIPMPHPPQYVAVSPDGTRAYVTLNDPTAPTNNVLMVDIPTHRIMMSIPIGRTLSAPAVSPDGGTLFVADQASSRVYAVDTAAGRLIGSFGVPATARGSAFSPNGRQAYIASQVLGQPGSGPGGVGQAESGQVSLIDVEHRWITTIFKVGSSPVGIAVAPDGRSLATADADTETVSIFDTVRHVQVATVHVGRNPRSVAYSPDGRHLYVVNTGSASVSVIDTAANRVTATLPTGDEPWAVAVSRDGRRAYVTNATSGSVTVLETGR